MMAVGGTQISRRARGRLCSWMKCIGSTSRSRMRFCRTWKRDILLFIGATTENPSFEVISPLLSRTKVYVLESHNDAAIGGIAETSLADKERGLGNEQVQDRRQIRAVVLWRMASFANGDARAAYNTLELCVRSASQRTKTRENRRQGRNVEANYGGTAGKCVCSGRCCVMTRRAKNITT